MNRHDLLYVYLPALLFLLYAVLMIVVALRTRSEEPVEGSEDDEDDWEDTADFHEESDLDDDPLVGANYAAYNGNIYHYDP